MKNFAIIATFLFASASLLAKEPIVETFDLAMGDTLDFSVRNGGSLEIKGWDRPTVELRYTLSSRNSDFFLESSRDGNTLTLIGDEDDNRKHGVNMKIMMPYQANLKLYTSGGNVSLNNLEGVITGQTMGGNFDFEQVFGEIEFRTMGGNVSGEDSELTGWIKTMGGNMNFKRVVGAFDSETMGGNVNMNNEGTFDNLDYANTPINLKTMGGNVGVDDAPAGVKAHTMGGNITIGKANQFVDADTKGGNISVDQIDGWIKAHTLGGDVTVTMTGDPATGDRDIEISSKGGDVTLYLPEDFGATFDVEIEISRDRRQEADIINDFGLQKTVDNDWTYKRGGSSVKTLKAQGSYGDGRHNVTVRTIDGVVEIRRK